MSNIPPNFSGIPLTLDVGASLIGLATAVVAVSALTLTIRANRTANAALLTDVHQRWEELHDEWSISRAFYFGPDSYYTDAPVSERARIRTLTEGWTGDYGSVEHDETAEQRQEGAHLRAVARFFAYVSDLVIRGNITPDEAYAVFGPDVARCRRTILWIAGRQRFLHPSAYGGQGAFTSHGQDIYASSSWSTVLDSMSEDSFHDEQATICLLAELLWATMARRGDHAPHLLLERAAGYKAGGWAETMEDLRSSTAFRLGPLNLRLRLRLHRRLGEAKKLRSRALTRGGEEIVAHWDDEIVRFRGRSKARKLKSQFHS